MRPTAAVTASALYLALTLIALPMRAVTAPGAPSASPPLPAGIERVTAVEGITEYRLANGLHVLLFPDQTQQTITVNVTYMVGSRFENYGETGMAHLLEHLQFKGSPRHRDIPTEMTAHGAQSNASTWYDRTNYFEVVPANDTNLEWALDLEADRMVNSFIAKQDLDSEMTVVRNEFEAGENSPQDVVEERAMHAAYDWHSYGKPTIGARSDIENVPIDRLQAFYHRYYQPDDAVLLVAGRIDPGKTLALVAQKLGAVPRPARVLPAIYTEEPVQDGEREVTVRRVGDVQVVVAAYHIPPGAAADSAAVALLAEILGNRAAGRLHKSLVETGKATSAQAAAFALHDPGLAIFGAQVPKDKPLAAAREALLDTLEAHFAPVTDAEVERARNAELRRIDLTLHSSTRLGLQLSESMAQGDWRLFFLQRDRVKRATAADVQRVAAAYLKPSNRTVGLFIPEAKPDRATIPARPDVVAMLKDYKGEAAMAEGEAFVPTPETILARTVRRDLPAGIKAAFLPKATRGGTVNLQLALHFGDERSLAGKATVGSLASGMLMRGSQHHTRQQIDDELGRLRAEMRVFGGASSAFVSIQTVRANLPATLRLAAEILRQPAFPPAELEQLERERITQAEASRSEPEAVASLALFRALDPLPKEHPDYVMTVDEQIAAIHAATLDQVQRFYADFYGASNAELAVVGDFDPQEVETLGRELFGSWASPRPFARIARTYREVPAADRSFETPDKANAGFMAGMTLPLRDDDPDYPALLLANYVLGGSESSRLWARIRQRDGLSYGVGSSLNASDLDQRGTFFGFAICAPQNMAKVAADFHEEVARARDGAFTAEEVAAAKAGFAAEREMRRTRDGSLASTLTRYLFAGRTYAWDRDLEAKVAALTPAELQQALRRRLDPARLVIVKAGDFAHAAAAPAKPAVPAAPAPGPRHR